MGKRHLKPFDVYAYITVSTYHDRSKVNEKMERLNIQLPAPLKAKLDALRLQGYTASGYIRALLEQELNVVSAMIQTGR